METSAQRTFFCLEIFPGGQATSLSNINTGHPMNDQHYTTLSSTFTDLFPLSSEMEPHLREAIERVLRNPGSLVRPRIVARMFDAYGLPSVHAAELGIAIEYFHTSSLLFDDLPCMDDAAERRGAPCIHAEFGEANAILTALALINRAYSLTWRAVAGCGGQSQGRQHQMQALDYVERYLGVGGLLNGQSMDLNYVASLLENRHPENRRRSGHQVTEAIAMSKTVSLIRLTLVLPGILGGAPPEELQLLDRIAVCWGLTYQIADDLKDILQSSAESGKTVSRDVSMGRPNIALAIGIPGSVHRLTRLIAMGDRMLQRLVARRPGIVFLRELRAQLNAEAIEIIDTACDHSTTIGRPLPEWAGPTTVSLHGAA